MRVMSVLYIFMGTVMGMAPLDRVVARSVNMVDLINHLGTTWKAGYNFPAETTAEEIKSMLGALPSNTSNGPKLLTRVHQMPSLIPDTFDARLQWPNCPTIGEIRDQANCGSCWAVAAAETMSDRICIHSQGTRNFHISAEDLMTCCTWCGKGCNGGHTSAAWQYWISVGIVTGGNYNSNQGCQPYLIPSCDHHMSGSTNPCGPRTSTPSCVKSCRPGYGISYKNDKIKGKQAYVISEEEDQIQVEIMKNGPVEAMFTFFEDFQYYKSGVYQHVAGDNLGHHAVRMLGWGTENDVDYWLVANSWNYNWGENGYFKIQRGVNECGIEQEITAGLP